MRWSECDVTGLVCSSCFGRRTERKNGSEARHFLLIEADETQARWLEKIFGDEEPCICENCLQGTTHDADAWLEGRVEDFLDERDGIQEAVRKVTELIEAYSSEAIEEEALRQGSEHCSSTSESHEVLDPDLRVELAFLELIPVWLNLQLLRRNSPRRFPPDEAEEQERRRRMEELCNEYVISRHRLYLMFLTAREDRQRIASEEA